MGKRVEDLFRICFRVGGLFWGFSDFLGLFISMILI